MTTERQDRPMFAIDAVVIGGGQAGLCMNYVLQEEGREHVSTYTNPSAIPESTSDDSRSNTLAGGSNKQEENRHGT